MNNLRYPDGRVYQCSTSMLYVAYIRIEGHTLLAKRKDREPCEAWLADKVRRRDAGEFGPGHVWGRRKPRKPQEVQTPQEVKEVRVRGRRMRDTDALLAALPGVHHRYRPDLALEIVRGCTADDIGAALGWDSARTRNTLDILLREGRVEVSVTRLGPLWRERINNGKQ